MRRFLAFGAAIVLSLAFVAQSGVSGEKKGPNQQDPPKDSQDGAASKAIRDLEAANLLVAIGRRDKHAESLLVAAQILHRTQTQPIGAERKATETANPKTLPAQDNTPKGLIAEAKKLSSAPHVMALAEATSKMVEEDVRGAVGGPKVDSFVIQPGQVVNWNPIRFFANQKAEVYIDNGTSGRMLLQVFDDVGNLVAQDNVPGSYYRCVWYPRWTGDFRFRLTNLDNIAFRCGMATN